MKKLIKKFIIVFLLFNSSLLITASQPKQNYPSQLSYKSGIVVETSDEKITYKPSDSKDPWICAIVYENGSVIYQVPDGSLTYFPNGSLRFDFNN